MTLPIRYRRNREFDQIRYDFIDIVEGVGVISFYCLIGANSSGSKYCLKTSKVASAQDDTSRRLGDGADVDFDTPNFSTPRTFKGTAYLSGEVEKAGSSITVTVTVQKFDGTTETNISSAVVSQTVNQDGANGIFIPIPLTETVIKPGELLRARVQVSGSGSFLYADPVGAAGFEPLKLLVPFKVDL